MKPAAIASTVIASAAAAGATLKRAVQFVFDRFLLLPLGAFTALVWRWTTTRCITLNTSGIRGRS
jgi:uncharacterized membrane protein YgaE (UPF0421/DUF939 family)